MSLTTTVLDDISEAIELWCRRIFNIETTFEKTTDLEICVTNTLKRQVFDGLISDRDFAESKYILYLWMNLYNSYLNQSENRALLFYLLELFDLKQITKEFFLHIATQVCQNKNMR